MPRVERMITIKKPMDEVFAFFTDVKNDPKWRGDDEVKSISIDGEMRQGSRIHQKLGAGPFGAPVKADMDVVVYKPPTAVAFQVVTGPLRPHIAFAFVPDSDSTTITFSIDAELRGIKKALMGGMAQKSMDHAAAALDEAKKLLEA